MTPGDTYKNYSPQTKQSAILRSKIYIIRRHTPMPSATEVPVDYVPSPCWQPMKRYEYTGSEAPAVVAETCIGVFVLNKDIRGRGYLLHFYIPVSLFFPFFRNFKCTWYLLNIKSISDGFHCSLAVATHVECGCDWNNLMAFWQTQITSWGEMKGIE